MTVAGVVPMHTPDEALEGLRALRRPRLQGRRLPRRRERLIPEPETGRRSSGPASALVRQLRARQRVRLRPGVGQARELGFAVTFHGGLGNMASGSFTSVSNYSFNHVGSFAQRMHHLVKSLFMGGVTRRFPDSGFAVLECGVGLGGDPAQRPPRPLGEAPARGPRAAGPGRHRLGPARGLMREHGPELLAASDDVAAGLPTIPGIGVPPADQDEWRHVGAPRRRSSSTCSPSFYFGCEADDRTIAYASPPPTAGLRAQADLQLRHRALGRGRRRRRGRGVVRAGRRRHPHRGAVRRSSCYENPESLFLDQNAAFFEGTPVAAHSGQRASR